MLNQILKDRKRKTRSLALILCLSMIVSLGTFAGFHQTAIAKVYTREVLDCPYAHEGAEPVAHVHNDDCYEGETLVCTLPEREAHTHTDECFTEQRVLVCGLEENPGHQHSEECYDENGELICQIPEGEGAHTHTEECYTIERVLTCERTELNIHVHDAGCFHTEEISINEPEETVVPEQTVNMVPEMPVSDPDADLETSDDWNREFENLELSGNWARDLVLVAATQQGRGESPNNFEAVLNDAGDAWVRHGYTRYGAWYGVPYAEEWSAMFVSFCLRYAGIPEENVPNNPTAAFMAESFSMGGLFAGRDYVPAVGDLIFFDTIDDEITNIDHMGIVYHVDTENGTINTVEGDRTDAVATFGYTLDDEQIVGYGILPQNPDYIPSEEENTDNTDEAYDGLIFMTTDEEEETEETETAAVTTDAEDVTAPAVPMPAQSWERTAGGIKVTVDAPEGAFPENTRIAVTPVNGNSLKDTVSDAVDGEVLEVQAVDITFFDADGREIEPAVPIRVVMTPAATENAEEKTSVVHIDITQQTAELIEQAAGTEFDNSEVVFDADAFTIYAIVYTYQVEYEYEVDGKTFTSSMPGAENMTLTQIVKGLGIVDETEIDTFVSKIASIASSNEEVAVVNENNEIRVLKDGEAKIVITMQDGAKFHIDVRAEGETEVTADNVAISTVGDLYLPAEAELKAEVVGGEQAIEAVKAIEGQDGNYQVFDISLDNVEVDNYDGFQVELQLPARILGSEFHLYHVHDGQVEELLLNKNSDIQDDGNELVESVSFVTDSFSYFVLSYTVDFTFEIDGQTFSYSMPGTTSASISDILTNLGIKNADEFTSKISSISFTAPELLAVTPIVENTTIGWVENQVFDIVFEETASSYEKASESELAAEDARLATVVTAPNWVLTSTAPFDTDEVLTIIMMNGEAFTIHVTDALYSGLNEFITDAELTINGQTYGKNDTWEVYPDTEYNLTLTFSEKGQRQLPSGGNTVMMKLPDGLTLPNGQSGTFDIPFGLAGTLRGNTYEVRDGYLYVTFARDPKNLLERSSNTHFEINLKAMFDEDATEIHFNDRVNPDVDVKNDGSVDVKKTGSYNASTGKMEYDITVTSTGTTQNIVINDIIGNNNPTIDIVKYNGDATVSGIDNPRSPTIRENGFSVTIPKMTDGQVAHIRYTADVDVASLYDAGYKITGVNGTNKVQYGKDGTPDKETEFKYENTIDFSNISKTSTGSSTDETNHVTTLDWTITANSDPKASIVGGTITDKIGWGSKDIMSYVTEDGKVPVSVTVKDENGNIVGTITDTAILDSGNPWTPASWTYTIPDLTNASGFTKDSNYNETIPAAKDQKYTYEISYQTKVTQAEQNQTVTNDSTNEHGGNSTGTGVVPGTNPINPPHPGGDPITVSKTATDVTQEYIEWKIVVNIPAGTDYTSDFYILDDLPWHYPDTGSGVTGGMVDTLDSGYNENGFTNGVKVEGLKVGQESYAVTTSTSNDKYLTDENGNTLERQIVKIQFYKDATTQTDSNKGLVKDETNARTLTVTVRTLNSAYWVQSGAKSSQLTWHDNNVNAMGYTANGRAQVTVPSIKKSGQKSGRPGYIQETEENKNDVYFAYDVVISNPSQFPIQITDSFDGRYLEFVGWDGLSDLTVDSTTGKVTEQYSGTYQYLYIKGGTNTWDNEFSGKINPGPYMPVYDYTAGSGLVQFTIPQLFKDENNNYYPYYHFRYYLKVRDAAVLTQAAIANQGKITLGNTVAWGNIDDHVDITYEVPVIDKDGWFANNADSNANERSYQFLIDVNPDALTFGNNNLEVVDNHSDNLSVDYHTVVAYEIPAGATVTKDEFRQVLQLLAKQQGGNDLQDWEQNQINALYDKCEISSLDALKANGVGWDFSGSEGTFSGLKDATHYFITYNALIVGTGSQTFSNEAEMEGYISSKTDSRWFDSNATAGGDVYQIQLLKHVKGNNAHGLAGATFQLFMDDGAGNPIPMTYGDTKFTRGEEVYEDISDGSRFNEDRENVVGQPITFTTDDNGYVLIKLNQTAHGAELEEGVHYYLKEIASPVGYKIDSSVEYWSFTLTQDPDGVNYGGRDAYGNRQWIYFYYDDILKMSNTPVENENVDLSVEKKWYDVNGNAITDTTKLENMEAKVQLYRRSSTGTSWSDWTAIKVDGSNITVGSDVKTLRYVSSLDELKFSWTDLPRSVTVDNVTTYYEYKVEEIFATDNSTNDRIGRFDTTVTSKESTDETTGDKIEYTVKNFAVEEKTKSLNIKKVWLDASGKTIDNPPDNITFKLYRVISKSPFEYQPTAGGSEFFITDNLPDGVQMVEDSLGNSYYQMRSSAYTAGVIFSALDYIKIGEENSSDVTYYAYYVKETAVDGYDSSSAAKTIVDESGNTTTTITLTNKKIPDERDTSLTIGKEWRWDDGTENGVAMDPPQNTTVTYQIYQVKSSTPFTDPTKVNSGGTLYDAKNSWGGYDWNWYHVNGQPGTYQLGVNNDWSSTTFNNLPAVRVNGNVATYYAYYVEEIDLPENIEASYKIKDNQDGTYSVLMTNKKSPEQTMVEVSKTWKINGEDANFAATGEPAKSWPDNVRVKVELLRDGTAVDGKVLYLTADKTSDNFVGLPKEDTNGNAYVYTVRETVQMLKENGTATNDDDWEETVMIDGKAISAEIAATTNGFGITNDLKTPGSLVVKKSFDETSEGAKTLTADQKKLITFTVSGPSGYTATKTLNDIGEDGFQYDSETGVYTWALTGLPAGSYTVKETNANFSGYSRTTTYVVTDADGVEGSSTSGLSASATVVGDKTTTVAFENKYTEQTDTGITVQKIWKDSSGNIITTLMSDSAQVVLDLKRSGGAFVPSTGTKYKIYLRTDYSSWGGGNVDNPIGEAAEGEFVTITLNDGDIRNVTPNANQWSYNLAEAVNHVLQFEMPAYDVRVWVNGNHDSITTSTVNNIVVHVGPAEPVIETITLNNANGWTWTSDSLPADDGNGNVYSYYVVENSSNVPGYSVSYEMEGGEPKKITSGTLTVTNTSTTTTTTDFTVKKAWTGADASTLTDKTVTFELFGIPSGSGSGSGDIPVSIAGNTYYASPGDQINLAYSVVVNNIDPNNQNSIIGKIISQPNNVTVSFQYLYYYNSDSSHSGQNYTLKLTPTYSQPVDLGDGTYRVDLSVSFTVDGSAFEANDITITQINVSDSTGFNIALESYNNSSATAVEVDWDDYNTQEKMAQLASDIASSYGVTPVSFGTFTLTYDDVLGDDHWAKKFEGLSTNYIYYAVEKTVDGDSSLETYSPIYGHVWNHSSETVTNTVTGPDTVTISATKTWDDKNQGSEADGSFTNHPALQFTLYRKALEEGESAPESLPKTVDEATTAGYTLAVENTEGFSAVIKINAGSAASQAEHLPATWSDLPEKDPDGKTYSYLVIEGNVPHYTIKSVVKDGTDGSNVTYAFTNELDEEKIDLTLNKKWNINGTEVTDTTAYPEVTYHVYQVTYSNAARTTLVEGTTDEGTEITTLPGDATGKLNNTNSWTETLQDLPKMKYTAIDENGVFTAEYYNYYVVEEPIPTDGDGNKYIVSYQVGDGPILDATETGGHSTSLNMGLDETSVTITNGKYEVEVNILKTDPNQTPLTGAEFKLEKFDGSWLNVYLTQDKDEDNNPIPGQYTRTTETEGALTVFTVGPDGKAKIDKLPNGRYRFVETKAPDGYIISEKESAIFTIAGGQINPEAENTARYNKAGNIFIVPNNPGTALPQTGGPGTALFTALGGLMTATAGAVLTLRRRRQRYHA